MAINEVSATRRRADLAKLRELQTRMPRALAILGVTGDPVRSIKLRISIPTAKNGAYPQDRQEVHDVEIEFPESYPLSTNGPVVKFMTPIWNPNVFPSGQWCYGPWNVTEHLELFVTRLMKVIALDPAIINPGSPANREAANWFVRQHSQHPKLFPTVALSGFMAEAPKPSIGWRSIK